MASKGFQNLQVKTQSAITAANRAHQAGQPTARLDAEASRLTNATAAVRNNRRANQRHAAFPEIY